MRQGLFPVDRQKQQHRIARLLTNYPSKNQPRDDIRNFVRACATTYNITGPVLDIGSGYRSNEPEICSRQLLDFYTLDTNTSYLPDFVCDASDMHLFDGGIFGCVVCTEMLEHAENPVKVISEIYRILERNGLFILTVPFWIPIHENSARNDYWRFTPKAIRLLLSDFEVHAIETSGEADKPTGVFAIARKSF